MIAIAPNNVYFDKLPDGRFERCVLQKTDESTPDRHAAARGGTGEFYKVMPHEEMIAEIRRDGVSARLDASVTIYDVEVRGFVCLEREEPPLPPILHVGDVVRHKATRKIGTITSFAHNGTTDVMVDETGPYPQVDFDRLSSERNGP